MPHSRTPTTSVLPSDSTTPSPAFLLQAALDELVQILQQPGPPSLRELLEAYSQKGNGDRELLLAMLSAKSSEDQRVAAVIQSHQTLIQAHAVAQQQIYQQQRQQLHLLAVNHGTHAQSLTASQMIAPPSPSGTSQSQSSSSSSPRSQTILPPLHSHLADLRSLPTGPQAKRRRTEPEAMMIDCITGSRGDVREKTQRPHHPYRQVGIGETERERERVQQRSSAIESRTATNRTGIEETEVRMRRSEEANREKGGLSLTSSRRSLTEGHRERGGCGMTV